MTTRWRSRLHSRAKPDQFLEVISPSRSTQMREEKLPQLRLVVSLDPRLCHREPYGCWHAGGVTFLFHRACMVRMMEVVSAVGELAVGLGGKHEHGRVVPGDELEHVD